MKIRALFPLAAAGLLILGGLSLVGARAFAQAPLPQGVTQNGTAELTTGDAGPDTDAVEAQDQSGDQNGAEDRQATPGQDTDNVQDEVGDQSAPDTGTEADTD